MKKSALANPSISWKLMRMNVLVSAIALILASVSFLAYDSWSFRQNMLHSLGTEAKIIGSNSISALTFDDADAASTTLAALRSSPHVVSALILTPDGQPFASYLRDSHSPHVAPAALTGGASIQDWARGDDLLLGSRIQFRGKVLGTVYIQSDTTEIKDRIRRYALIAGGILFVCLLSALVLTSSMRRVIADPITALAAVAQTVSREKDYSIRADTSQEPDEIGVLVQSFNEMLAQIQQRDGALIESRNVLEQRVEERTAELQSANRELEAFSYSVAHDLRGPLDSVGNIVFLVAQADLSGVDDHTREMLTTLPAVTSRMSGLIDDLLNLSRSKSTALHLEPLDLSRMAGEIVRDLAVAEPDRVVQVEIGSGTFAIADEGLTRVVLANLLGNAWKYSAHAEAARIEFGTFVQGKESVFYVRDNGAGFDPRLKSRLFQPFQRLHAQSDFAGTGIGLATVARIIERHGGRIWADGKIGKGASFYFTLS